MVLESKRYMLNVNVKKVYSAIIQYKIDCALQ